MGDSSLQPEGAVVAAVTAILVSGVPPATMAAVLAGTLGSYGVTPGVAQAALVMVLKSTFTPQLPPGPAAQAIAYAQAGFRAAYLVASAVRIQNGVNAGTPLVDAIRAESRFRQLHIDAQANRQRAAAQVDTEAGGDPNARLIWKAKLDSRTSAECRAANGLIFTAATVPVIGYPGAVHPHCRCKAKKAPIGYRAKHVDSAMSAALIGADH